MHLQKLETVEDMKAAMEIQDRKIALLDAELERMCERNLKLQVEIEILKGKISHKS